MDANIVSWIITGIVGLMLLSGVFWGMKRGLKKSLFRFVWILATAIILFFITPIVSGAVNNIDLSGLDINIMGKVTKLSDVGVNIFASFVGREQLESNADLMAFAQNVSTVFLNVLLFVVLFWVTRFLLWIIWAPIAHKNFDQKSIEKKKFKKEQKKKKKESKGIDVPEEEMPLLLAVKENKHRGWGALIGLATGLVIVACTFMPIVGVNNIYQNVYANVTYEEDGQEKYYLEEIIDEELRGYINTYQNSIANPILTYTGVNGISNLIFNNMASVKIGNEKIYVEEAITSGVKVYKKAMILMKFDIDNVSKEGIDEALGAVRDIFGEIKKVKGIYVLADTVLPKMIKDRADDVEINVGPAEVSSYVVDMIKSYDELSLLNLQNQVEAVLNIVQEINSRDLIVPIVKAEEEITPDFIFDLIATNVTNVESFTDAIFDNLYLIDILEKEYPRIIDEGFSSLFDMLGIEYEKQTVDGEIFTQEKIDSVKEGFKTIFANIIKFIKLYANSQNFDFDAAGSDDNVLTATINSASDYANTLKALNSVGEILNVFRVKRDAENEWQNFLSETNYASLIGFLKDKANELAQDFADISSVVNSLDSIDNWKTELTNYPALYRAIIHIVNSEKSFDELIDENDYLLDDIGVGLGIAVENSKLINNQNLRAIVEELLQKDEYVDGIKDVLDIVIEGDTTVRMALLNNIYNPSPSAEVKSNVGSNWANEIVCLKKILNIDFSDFEIGEIGGALDDASTSKIFTKLIINSIVIDKIDEAVEELFGYDNENPMPDSLSSAITQLKNNLRTQSSNEAFTYSAEFGFVQGLFDAVDKNDYEQDLANNRTVEEVKLVAIGKELDRICGNSLILTKTVLNNILSYYMDEHLTSLSSLDSDARTTILGIKNNFNLIESYEFEFANLIDLAKVANTTYEADTVNNKTSEEVKLLKLGEQFDKLLALGDYTTNTASKMITGQIISDLLDVYLDSYIDNLADLSSDLKTIVKKVKNNLSLIESYEVEFNNLLDVASVVNSSTSTLTQIGEELDTIKNNSKIITSSIISEMVDYYFDRETQSYLTKYGTVISKIKTKIGGAYSYETMFSELNDITSELSNYDSLSSSNIEDAGQFLDEMANMTQACDKVIAKDIATIFIDELKADYPSLESEIDEVLEEENFASYGASSTDNSFFSNLFTKIKNKL